MPSAQASYTTRTVSNANAIVVQNAMLDSKYPLTGIFEIVDPDFSVQAQADGFLHVNVLCDRQGLPPDDLGLLLRARFWECLVIEGFDGDVVAEVVIS